MYIGIIGHMGAGKTTRIGRYLDNEGFRRFHPAHTLRRMLYVFLEDMGYDENTIEQMLDGTLKRSPLPTHPQVNPTSLQQSLGTEWGRNLVDPNIWNFILSQRIKKAGADFPNIYNDSIRFPNEVDAVLEERGYLLRVIRPGQPVNLGHISEQHIPTLPYHFAVVNDGDYEHVARQMSHIMSLINRYPYKEFQLNYSAA